MARKLSTTNYTREARLRLGEAVAKAREASGHMYRTTFAREHGIKSLRSLELLEAGDPGVGQSILWAVGRALPGWDEDTPRVILEGGPIPSTVLDEPDPVDDINEEMLAHLRQQYRVVADMDAGEDEIAEFLDLLKKMWHKREPNIRRFRHTVERFAEEVQVAELADTERGLANGTR